MPDGREPGITGCVFMSGTVQTWSDHTAKLFFKISKNTMNDAIEPVPALVIGILSLLVQRLLK
jgi:hypothetical protein